MDRHFWVSWTDKMLTSVNFFWKFPKIWSKSMSIWWDPYLDQKNQWQYFSLLCSFDLWPLEIVKLAYLNLYFQQFSHFYHHISISSPFWHFYCLFVFKGVLHLWALFLKTLCIFSKNKATLDKVSYGSGQKWSEELENYSFTSVETIVVKLQWKMCKNQYFPCFEP